MLLRLFYLALTGMIRFLRLLAMSNADKDIEILALRHQLTVWVPNWSSRAVTYGIAGSWSWGMTF